MTAKSTRTLLQIHLALFLLLALLTLPNNAQEDTNRTMITSPNDAIIYSHLSRNYNASSATLEMMTRKWEEEMKIQREKMRRDWKRTFDEIREGRIGRNTANVDDALSNEDGESQNEDGRAGGQEEVQIAGSRLLDRWKLFLDSKSPKTLRFDGFTSWDKQLQQWSEDVSAYISENVTWTELLKAKEGGGYDLGKFGVTSKGLKELSKLHGESAVDGDDTGSAVSATKTKRFGLDSTSNAPIGTLPIALTALEPNLPDLPKPHPVLPGEAIVPHTDISDLSKNIWIVTTASLPWMTGTAVNPLLRAAYLTRGRKDKGGSVTLLLPWVERPSDQKRIYGKAERFANPDDQEEYIRNWLHDEADMKDASVDLNIKWYTAWQEVAENSLYSMGDLIALIPEEQCDICVLEEPEHLNWYRAPGENWTSKFKHVVGIVHTNYFVYAQEQPAAFIRAPGMRLLCSWMCRAHCHRLIKLSGTLGNFAPEKELVENVHGVRRTFLDIGGELRNRLTTSEAASDPVFSADASPKVYFIGKMLWSKGLGSLMELMKYAEESAGLKVTVDMYGGGPNKDEASEKASGMGLDMPFHGPIDHSELGFSHKIFVNPSLSEVLCTTVAEALAMGKFVVLPNHPSNDFFAQFPNCLPYSNKEEFVGKWEHP
jgi:digalactosyldiacylglycerol synthase